MYIVIVGIAVILVPVIVAIFKGYSVTKPTIRAFSIGPDLRRHEIKISQAYLGPAKNGPQSHQILETAARIVERMSGYDKEPPLITMEDIRSLPPVFLDRK